MYTVSGQRVSPTGWVCAVLAIVATQAHAGAGPAHGLIVKFKDAPPHEVATRANAGIQHRNRARQVLTAIGMSTARMRAVGRAAQRFDFGHVLGRNEAAQMAAKLRAQPEVEWVVPNEIERRLQVPNDPRFTDGSQWWLKPTSGSNGNQLSDRLRGVPGFQSAWATTLGSPTAIVAVLDTGITSHPDIDPLFRQLGYDFVSEVEYANDGDGFDPDPSDPGDWVSSADKNTFPLLFGDCVVENSSWHGTSISGVVAALTNNFANIAATSWDGRVLPVRVAGKCGATISDIIDGMRWAAGLPVVGVPNNPLGNRARVINISFGGDAPCNAAYQSAINELSALGVVVIAAAGNNNMGVARPANCSGVIGVAALNRDGFKATYSNFGASVIIATVGGDPSDEGAWRRLGDPGIRTISNSGAQGPTGHSERNLIGTSYAAPIVAGTVSLMLSANSNLTAAQIIDGLKKTARPHVISPKIGLCSNANPGRCICTATTCGAGILDTAQAVLYALNPATYVAPASSPAIIDNIDVDAALLQGAQDKPANFVPPPIQSDSGGGAADLSWLLAVALAVGIAARLRREPR